VCGRFGKEEEEAGDGGESWVAPLCGHVGGHRSRFLAGCLIRRHRVTCFAACQEGRLKIPAGGPSAFRLPTSSQFWGGGSC